MPDISLRGIGQVEELASVSITASPQLLLPYGNNSDSLFFFEETVIKFKLFVQRQRHLGGKQDAPNADVLDDALKMSVS